MKRIISVLALSLIGFQAFGADKSVSANEGEFYKKVVLETLKAQVEKLECYNLGFISHTLTFSDSKNVSIEMIGDLTKLHFSLPVDHGDYLEVSMAYVEINTSSEITNIYVSQAHVSSKPDSLPGPDTLKRGECTRH